MGYHKEGKNDERGRNATVGEVDAWCRAFAECWRFYFQLKHIWNTMWAAWQYTSFHCANPDAVWCQLHGDLSSDEAE